jgi:hypothetical protein
LSNHKKVISFPVSPVSGWRFWDCLEGIRNPIEDWYQGLSEDDGQNIFDSIIKGNKKADNPTQWHDCKMLQGKAKEHGIWEWRFFADGKQQRLLGIFGRERKQAIFLIGCTHKQRVYDPPECIDTAIRKAKDVRAGRASTSERQITEDI